MKKKNVNYTDEENKLLDWAVDKIIKKYIEQGGNPEKMESRNFIDYCLCVLLYEKGSESVIALVDNYEYNPLQSKQPIEKVNC